MSEFQQILLPTDFSPAAWQAFAVAEKMALAFDAKIHLIHVVEESFYRDIHGPELFDKQNQVVDAVRKYRMTSLQELRQKIPEAIRGEAMFRSVGSDAATEIVSAAQKLSINLIVMATHGRTGWDHVMIGSVAERVVRLSTCPVITVPLSKQEAKG